MGLNRHKKKVIALQAAVTEGRFRSRDTRYGGTNMLAVVDTALDIAQGMAYMHEKGVLHGVCRASFSLHC